MTQATVTETADGGVELTELVKIEPTRVDGVGTPANGFPVLMMKALPEGEPPAGDGAEETTPVVEDGDEAAKQTEPADAPTPEQPVETGDEAETVDTPPLTPLQVAQQRAAEAAKDASPPPAATEHPAGAPSGRRLLDPEQYQRALAYADQALTGALTAKALFAKADPAGATLDGDGSDEADDLDSAAQILVLLARLIASEAEELARGDFREATDICILLEMVHSLQYFIGREEDQAAGSFAPAEAGSTVTIAMSALDDGLLKAKYTAEQLRQMLADGKAFKNPDGEPSYPIGDTEDLGRAIKAVGRGKGDHDAVRAYIIRRAKALGASDEIPENWNSDGTMTAAKSAAAPQTSGTDATAPTPETLTEIVTKAVAEANKTSQGRIEALEAELAKVKATPIPGGPVLIAPPRSDTTGRDGHATKAAQYRATAARVTDAQARNAYLALAAEEDAKAAV